jgi:hypothetical protein
MANSFQNFETTHPRKPLKPQQSSQAWPDCSSVQMQLTGYKKNKALRIRSGRHGGLTDASLIPQDFSTNRRESCTAIAPKPRLDNSRDLGCILQRGYVHYAVPSRVILEPATTDDHHRMLHWCYLMHLGWRPSRPKANHLPRIFHHDNRRSAPVLRF